MYKLYGQLSFNLIQVLWLWNYAVTMWQKCGLYKCIHWTRLKYTVMCIGFFLFLFFLFLEKINIFKRQKRKEKHGSKCLQGNYCPRWLPSLNEIMKSNLFSSFCILFLQGWSRSSYLPNVWLMKEPALESHSVCTVSNPLCWWAEVQLGHCPDTHGPQLHVIHSFKHVNNHNWVHCCRRS